MPKFSVSFRHPVESQSVITFNHCHKVAFDLKLSVMDLVMSTDDNSMGSNG